MKSLSSPVENAAGGDVFPSHLDDQRDMQSISNRGLQIYVRQDFMTAAECDHLIRSTVGRFGPSQNYGRKNVEGIRSSETCRMPQNDEIAIEIDTRICMLLGIDPVYGEYLQIQKYDDGGYFKPHFDCFNAGDEISDEQITIGQRAWTAIVYLNEVEGGETEFPAAALSVKPQTGTLIAWNNLKPDGRPNLRSLHAGNPVKKGPKYILTKWFRTKPWYQDGDAGLLSF